MTVFAYPITSRAKEAIFLAANALIYSNKCDAHSAGVVAVYFQSAGLPRHWIYYFFIRFEQAVSGCYCFFPLSFRSRDKHPMFSPGYEVMSIIGTLYFAIEVFGSVALAKKNIYSGSPRENNLQVLPLPFIQYT